MHIYLLRVRWMKGGLICTWISQRSPSKGMGPSGISCARGAAQLSASVRGVNSASLFPQRLKFEKKIRSEKDWVKFHLFLRCSPTLVWPCTRRGFQALVSCQVCRLPFQSVQRLSRCHFQCEFFWNWSLSWGKLIEMSLSTLPIWKESQTKTQIPKLNH